MRKLKMLSGFLFVGILVAGCGGQSPDSVLEEDPAGVDAGSSAQQQEEGIDSKEVSQGKEIEEDPQINKRKGSGEEEYLPEEANQIDRPIYSVDEFVETGFRDGGRVLIRVRSVTCYNNSCGVEGGSSGQWGIAIDADESGKFYSYAGKGVDMIIEAEPSCEANTEKCSKIENVSILEIN
jgi:hypothetical protein